MNPERVSLHELVPNHWFRRPQDSSGWVRIYSSLGLGHAEFLDQVSKMIRSLEGSPIFGAASISVIYGHLEGFESSSLSSSSVANADGSTRVIIRVLERPIPLGNNIVFAVPFRIDGRQGKQAVVQAAMNRGIGAMMAHLGSNLLAELVYEGEVSAVGRDRTFALPLVKMEQATDGPYLEAATWNDFCAAMARLENARSPKKERVELALEYLHQGIRSEFGFFEYWVSLELLCNGKAGRIASRIAKCHGWATAHEAIRETPFGQLNDWRDDFFHEGKRPLLVPKMERYIQLLFIDLLRNELDLAPRRYALGFDQGETPEGALPGYVTTHFERYVSVGLDTPG